MFSFCSVRSGDAKSEPKSPKALPTAPSSFLVGEKMCSERIPLPPAITCESLTCNESPSPVRTESGANVQPTLELYNSVRRKSESDAGGVGVPSLTCNRKGSLNAVRRESCNWRREGGKVSHLTVKIPTYSATTPLQVRYHALRRGRY